MIQAGATLQQRYKIDKQIGQGGMGAVYIGTDVRFGSTVAIKETLCMDSNFRKAIEREARLLNSLKHNALPRVSDHFEENDSQFLVMEYIAGDDVATLLECKECGYPVDQVLKWADDLLDALDYLHNQEVPVIHRDIKPQNLKITPRGQIILLDFGLAKGNPTDAGHNTAAKSIFGYSRNYASLEQIQGTGTDPRSDLYSLAATLYHLVTYTPPEDALTRAMSVLSHRPDPLRPACDVDPVVPRGVAGVLHQALDLNAAGRPASAAVMRQMLRDSESYGYLAEPITIASGAPGQRVSGQQTQAANEATQAAHLRHTEAKTELLPAFQSQVTSVAGAAVAEPTSVASGRTIVTAAPGRRNFGLIAGALALLLVGGGIAGGLYVVKPSVFGISSDLPGTEAALPVANAAAPDAETADEANSAVTSADTSSTVPGPGTTHQSASAGRPSSTSRETTSTDSGPADQSATSANASVPNDTNRQTIIVTREPNDVFQPAPVPNVRLRPVTPGFDPRHLTPEQRRKLQRALRMQNNPPANMMRQAPRANRP